MSFLISIRHTLKIGILPLLLLPSVVMVGCSCNNYDITATTNHLQDNNNGTVSDPKTGLIWKKCSEGQSYNSVTNSCDNTASTYNWAAALQQAQDVNAATSGENLGQNDWRVPNIKELGSIVESSCVVPAINQVVFPATPSDYNSSAYYWSSSPPPFSVDGAWVIDFSSGFVGGGIGYDYSHGHVRLVRSGQ